MSAQPTPTLSHLSAAFEPDMDSFFDLEQNDITPSLSPDSARSESQRASMVGASSSSFGSRQQPLSGPSHQYDAYRQQTGLPAGGLASTFAVNRATGMQYTPSSSGFVMPVETLNFPLPSNDDFDFNANPSYDINDMDFEADSPSDNLPAMFYPGKTQFVNPSAITGEPSYTPQVQRMYPGMHSQQAAQAAQAKKQQELARQQQQQQRLPEGQRPLPSQKAPKSNDPAVDDRISRLLQQMRHNSMVSAEEEPSQGSNSLPQMSKLKKEEEEMDEDERLLASEEGKKLSSKERRQLRNKVSARAFRSRRKEYIGQLEGEVAAKAQEANDLRAQNRQLMEENNRLTDLTRVLLSSPAFSGFLNELSANGGSVPSALQKTSAQQAPQQPHAVRKDINPHQVARQLQSQQQVGMVMVPEPQVDLSALNLNAQNGWNSGIDMNAFQVFAVTELPQGPAIDVNALSGKSSSRAESKPVVSKDLPTLPSIPASSQTKTEEPKINDQIELDPSLSLFEVTAPKSVSPRSLASIPTRKPQHFNLITVNNLDSTTAATTTLEKMCAELDEACTRLDCFTSHL